MTPQILIKYLTAILIISFISWNRFFRIRGVVTFVLPTSFKLFTNVCIIILYLNIKKIFNIDKKSKSIETILELSYIKKLQIIFQEFTNSPKFLYKDITDNFNLAPILEKPASYFTVYCYYPRIIVTCFLNLPLIIVASFFAIDNIFFDNLNHFYFVLPLLIPLLFMEIWLFIIESYSKRRLNHLHRFLIIENDPILKRFRIYLKPDNELPISDDFPLHVIKQKFRVLCNFWEIYRRINSFMNHINSYRNKYGPYIQVYTSVCFLFGWLIQLYYKLNFIL